MEDQELDDLDRSGVGKEGEVEGQPSKTLPGEWDEEHGVFAV